MTTFRRVLLGLGVVALACSVASADTLYSTSVAVPVTFTTDGSYTLTLNKFDSSLGNLTGATLYFYAKEDVTNLSFTNTTGLTQTLDVALTSNLVFNSANSANNADKYNGEVLDLFDTNTGYGPGTAQLPQSPGQLQFAVGETKTYPNETIQNIDAIYGFNVDTGMGSVTGVTKTISGSDLNNYKSPGLATFTLSGETKSPFSGVGTIRPTSVVNATFAAEIDYTYTLRPPPSDTPEPTTLVLMGTALAGVGLLRKRIKA